LPAQFLYHLFECSAVILETLIIYQYISVFSENGIGWYRVFSGYAVFCVGLMFFSLFCRLPIALIIYCGLGIFALEIFVHKISFLTKLYLPLLFCIIVAVAELISVGIVTILFRIDFESALENGTARAVGIVISKLILTVLLNLTRVIAKSKMGESSAREFKLALPLYICPILSLALTYFVFIVGIEIYDYLSIEIFLSLLAILYLNFVVFWYFDSVKSIFDMSLRSEAAEAKLEHQTKYYALFEEHQRDTVAMHHDMRKHILVIKSLICDGQREFAEEYVSELEKRMNQGATLIRTPHPVISALLTELKIKAQKLNVDLEVRVNLISDIRINSTDLCVLIGNLVDNAIEACELLPLNSGAFVKVEIAQRDSKLLIYVENAYSPNSKNPDRSGRHGVGLKNVQKVVGKCGGLMNSNAVNGIYSVRIIIP